MRQLASQSKYWLWMSFCEKHWFPFVKCNCKATKKKKVLFMGVSDPIFWVSFSHCRFEPLSCLVLNWPSFLTYSNVYGCCQSSRYSSNNKFKLNSYSNASVFLSLCLMRISVFWGQERLTDRSISKRYLKSDITTWVEKSSTSSSRAIHAHDTGFYWSSENALHERFITSSDVGVWMKMLQLIAKR